MGVVNEIIDLITGHRQNSSFVPTFGRQQRRGGCLICRPSTGCCACARSHTCGLVIGFVDVLLVGVFISIFVFHCVFVFVFVLPGLC